MCFVFKKYIIITLEKLDVEARLQELCEQVEVRRERTYIINIIFRFLLVLLCKYYYFCYC